MKSVPEVANTQTAGLMEDLRKTSETNQVAPLSTLASAQLEKLMTRGAANYEDELRMALKLSVREEHQSQELQSAENKEIRAAMELSMKEEHRGQRDGKGTETLPPRDNKI